LVSSVGNEQKLLGKEHNSFLVGKTTGGAGASLNITGFGLGPILCTRFRP